MRFAGSIGKFSLALALAAVTGYVFINNQDHVQLHVPPVIEHMTMPVWMVTGLFFLLGAAVTTFALALDNLGKALEIRRLRRRLAREEQPAEPAPVTTTTVPSPATHL